MKKLLLFLALSVILISGCISPYGSKDNGQAPPPPLSGNGNPSDASNNGGGEVAFKGTIKFGAMLPLTGTRSFFGENMQNGMLLAVDEINAAGGINGKKLELVIEDTQCDRLKALPAANKLVTIDRISALAGPACTDESKAISQLINDNKIVTISPSASSSELSISGGDYWFRLVPSDDFQAKVASLYVRQKLAMRRAAILYMDNAWGIGLKDSFKASFMDLGGIISTDESFAPGASSMRVQLSKIRSLNNDMIYLVCYPEECVTALKEISELGIKYRVIGTDGADDAATIAQAGNASDGLIITIASGAIPNGFTSSYKTKYGEEAGAYAAQSYDAVKLLAEASKGGEKGEGMKNYLYGVKYKGAIGDISFDKNGDLVSVKYDIKAFQNGTYSLIGQVSPE